MMGWVHGTSRRLLDVLPCNGVHPARVCVVLLADIVTRVDDRTLTLTNLDSLTPASGSHQGGR